jgi:hypothetical protein
MFPAIHKGICLFCGKPEKVIRLANTLGLANALSTAIAARLAPADGICNECSYSLRNHWMAERSELIRAASPQIVLTYLLVPSILPEHSDKDITAYEFLIDSTGNVPSTDFWDDAKRDPKILDWLEKVYGVVSWQPMLKRCYLGYNPSGQFSEVLLVRAWGRSYAHPVETKQSSFHRLLGQVVPEAGFYLGVMNAFEALLWRHEAVPAGNELCVTMRESAMRYIRFQSHQDKPPDNTSVSLCHGLMSPLEKKIAGEVLGHMAKVADVPPASQGDVVKPDAVRAEAARVAEAARAARFDEAQGEEAEGEGEEDLLDENRAPEGPDPSAPPGFARGPRTPFAR